MRKDNAKGRVGIIFPDESKAEQAHAEESDINKIMARAMAGQSSDYIKEYGGRYGDATSLDFFEANIIIANTNEMFDALPSEIRNRFQNKPEKFLDFVQDPENEKELIKLKLANPKPNIEPPGEPLKAEPPKAEPQKVETTPPVEE